MTDLKDCYANISKDKCFALTEKNCEGCNFYKHSDNPEAERAKIETETRRYNSKYTNSKYH